MVISAGAYEHEYTQETQRILLHCAKLTEQLLFKTINLKVDHHIGGNWFHGAKHRQEKQSLARNTQASDAELWCFLWSASE